MPREKRQEKTIDYSALSEIAVAIAEIKKLQLAQAVIITHPVAMKIGGGFVEFDLLPDGKREVENALKKAFQDQINFYVKRLEFFGVEVMK